MRKSVFLGAVALAFLLGAAGVGAKEERVPKDRIPKAVMDALLARFPKAKIDTCVKEKEGGDVVYDIEFKVEGRHCESDIKENGAYINFEQAIKAGDLPKAVRDAIDQKYPRARLKEIMQETEVHGKDEKLSAYEVVLVPAGKKEVEVRVSPEGKILEDSSGEKGEGR